VKKPTISVVAPYVVVLGAWLAAAGCSSTGAPSGEQSTEKLTRTVADAQGGVDAALVALLELVQAPGDMVMPRYDSFAKSIASLEGRAKAVRTEANAVKAQGDGYFDGWKPGARNGGSEGASKDDSVSAENRRAELCKACADVRDQMVLASDALDSFLASLNAVKSQMAFDLTVKGVEGAAPLTREAQESGAEAKSRIEAAMRQVDSVRGMLAGRAGEP
jgi:hypothetical protein